MTIPSEKLAKSLEELHALQAQGVIAIRTADLKREHRDRLTKHGFLQRVIKGWYIPSRPDEQQGESTAWYASFWDFCAAYLKQRFNNAWCLSPEQSLLLHAQNWTVPKQLLVRSPNAQNNVTPLLFNTSLLDAKYLLPDEKEIEVTKGLRVFSLHSALINCSSNFFKQHPTDARAILAMVQDASEVLPALLEGGHPTIAGRLAGAFRNIGNKQIADNIIKSMQRADYTVREQDPFEFETPILFEQRPISPYVSRVRLLWHQMRKEVIKHFPKPKKKVIILNEYLEKLEEKYAADAYHSLSIEGYRVSHDLIERVKGGGWNPSFNEKDKEHKNALAARGYWLAFQEVKKSIKKIINGKNAADVVRHDHADWYGELFSPSVTAGILKPTELAGYRNEPVFIRRSQHVPPNSNAVKDLMPAFFDLLKQEKEPAVRVVLGHFFFVYIHPYMDGNGRIGRFLMNAMCASGGYAWTIVPVEHRNEYMATLEKASVEQNIKPFCEFLANLVEPN